MGEMRFDKLTVNQWIKRDEIYVIPLFNPKQPTHVGIRNGQLAFFWSDSSVRSYHSNRHWHFWKIPDGAVSCCFPDFQRAEMGCCYGRLTWNFT